MHVRLGASLADHQRRALEETFAARGREFIERHGALKSRLVKLAHDAEFGARIEHEPARAVAIADQVAAIAEKDEATVNQPAQQVAHFDELATGGGFLADL